MQLTDQLQHNQSFLDFFEKYLRILLNVSSLVILLRAPLWLPSSLRVWAKRSIGTCKPSSNQAVIVTRVSSLSPPPHHATTVMPASSNSPNIPGIFLPQDICAFYSALCLVIFPILFSCILPKEKKCFECLHCAWLYGFKQGVQGRYYREGNIWAKTWREWGIGPCSQSSRRSVFITQSSVPTSTDFA